MINLDNATSRIRIIFFPLFSGIKKGFNYNKSNELSIEKRYARSYDNE